MALIIFKMAAARLFSGFFSGCASFNLMVFKLGMYVHLDNHSDEFENGADQIQNGRRSAIIYFFAFNVAALRALPISDGLFLYFDLLCLRN